MGKRVAMALAIVIAGAAAASAQSTTSTSSGQSTTAQRPADTTATSSTAGTSGMSTQSTQQQPTVSDATETRPATTTINGDTGLWFVPTGEVLPAKKWSLSAYRVNFDRDQGFTDVSDWPVTVGVGLGDRAELFGAWTLVRRIDRDVRPLFVASAPVAGGVVNEHPFVRQGWSDNQLGDLWLGAKITLTSQWRQQSAAVALRGMVKPANGKDNGEAWGPGSGICPGPHPDPERNHAGEGPAYSGPCAGGTQRVGSNQRFRGAWGWGLFPQNLGFGGT